MNSKAKKSSSGPSWFFVLIAVPALTYWLSGPYINAWLGNSETGPSGYAIIAKEFPALSTRLQHHIATATQKGYLTNDEVNGFVTGIVREKGSVQTSPAPDFGDDKTPSLGLIDLVLGNPQNSHSKRKLLSLTENH